MASNVSSKHGIRVRYFGVSSEGGSIIVGVLGRLSRGRNRCHAESDLQYQEQDIFLVLNLVPEVVPNVCVVAHRTVTVDRDGKVAGCGSFDAEKSGVRYAW